jgi:hypothetical protein
MPVMDSFIGSSMTVDAGVRGEIGGWLPSGKS